MCILIGLASCYHYYAANPPPEAYKPGWDGDAQVTPFVSLERFFFIMAGGVIALSLGFYFRRKTRNKK